MPGGEASPAVHDTGTGEAVVWLHAFPLDAAQWDHQVARASGRFRCLRFDMWGCGESPAPPDDATLDGFAAAILERLEVLGVDRFSVVGLSMGGYVAFALWRLAAPRINALVLSNTRAGSDTDATRADRELTAERALRESSVDFLIEPNVARLLGARAQREAHITDPLRGMIRRWTPAGVAAAQRAMAARPDSTAMLHDINVPVLVVAGTEDSVISRDQSTAMAGAIGGARFSEFKDCGHLANLEVPELFGIETVDFLASAGAG